MQKSLCARSKLSNMGCYRCNWLQFYTPFRSLEIKLEGGVWKSWYIFNGIIFAEGYFTSLSPRFLFGQQSRGLPGTLLSLCLCTGWPEFLLLVSLRIFDSYLVWTHRTMLSGAVMHPTCVLFSPPGPSLRLKGRLEILLCDTIKWRSLTLFSADGKRLFSCNLKPLFKWHGVF